MKKLSLLLALIMLATTLVPAFAEAPAGPTEKEILEMPCEFSLIEADEAIGQPRLTYMEGVTPILEKDGLKFKDLNKNGELDIYEDYRQDIEARVQDLISQLTIEEEAGLHFCVSANLNTARAMIPDFKNNCMLFNLNGAPVAVVNTLNNLQATGEAERLGIPMTFTSDRAYNAFGGYIDMPHIAFGTANDPELAYKLSYIYGEAMVAVGVHVTFEPYANEIGAQYGENPEHIAAIVSQTVKGLEDSLGDHMLGLMYKSGKCYFVDPCREYDDVMMALDTYFARVEILNGIYKNDEGKSNVSFDAEFSSVRKAMEEKKHDVAVILNPPSLKTIWDLAGQGKRMPKKTTFFYPKIWSGWVFYLML